MMHQRDKKEGMDGFKRYVWRLDSNQSGLTVEYKGEGVKDLRFQGRW